MDVVVNGLIAVLLVVGCFFILTGGVGVLRFPDFHSRMHPAAKSQTPASSSVR